MGSAPQANRRNLTVFDGGNGMDEIVKAFRLGASVGLGPEDIGRYGCGGTMAMIWPSWKISGPRL